MATTTYSQKPLLEEVQSLIAVSNTGDLLSDALANGARLVLLLPPRVLIEALLRQNPPREVVQVVALFHVLDKQAFEEALMECAASRSSTRLETVSGYPLTLVCSSDSGMRQMASNRIERADISSTPVSVPLGPQGQPVTVYRVSRVLEPIPAMPAHVMASAGAPLGAEQFEQIEAKLAYVGPDVKIENGKFVEDRHAFGHFMLEAIREMLLAEARVVYGSSVVADKVISKASDYDENMFVFQLDRVGKCAIIMEQYHARGFADKVSKFLDCVMKAWPYLKGKQPGKKIETALGQTGSTESGYKTALIAVGFGKRKLVGKPTEIVSELQPIAKFLGSSDGKDKAMFANFFVGLAYMIDNNWKAASNWFDDAVEAGYDWISGLPATK